MNELWRKLSLAASVPLTLEQHDRLSRYLDLLIDANQTMNLTAITDRAQAELLHVADALTLLPFLPAGPHRLADVGSGGGVPGIPLAIARPDAHVLLIESTKKKAAFLRKAVEALELANVEVSDDRAEDVGRSARRESFDAVVARAVGPLERLAEYCLPLVKQGGRLMAMKGARAAEELPAATRAIRILGGDAPQVVPIDLPGTSAHVIVRIEKRGRTDARYPRPPSIAKGRPIT